MAKDNAQTDLDLKQKGEVATTQFESFEGTGFEEVTTEDLAIPFIRILAQLSPQVNKRDGAYVEGAEAGHIYNTVQNEVYDGTQGISVIPCYYSRKYVEWTPREKGGGYIQSYATTDPIVKTAVKNELGQDILPDSGNLLSNTSHFFVLHLHKTLGPQRGLITMTSTQLKKGRKWLTQAQQFTAKKQNGSIMQLPLMSQVYTLKTVEEKNDKGNWFGWDISHERQIDLSNDSEQKIFEMGVQFAKSIAKGEVEVKSEQETSSETKDESVM